MNWSPSWRDEAWLQLDQEWDVLIIGGGITGAGILRLACQAGLRTALVEAYDFASGTSSRSSKLVHGGLRYLKNAQLSMTIESVREREALLKQGRGLVNRLGFLYACQRGDKLPGWVFGVGLVLYDLLSGLWSHRAYDTLDMRELCPLLTTQRLSGGYRYFDAQTDDARLVLRLIQEASAQGGLAINYTRLDRLLRNRAGQVCGGVLYDSSGVAQREKEVRAKVVINATGAWVDGVRAQLGRPPRLRPLRGSHLVLPWARLPITRAISFLHPLDGRPVFALPWEGVVLFGTTDIEHGPNLQIDPAISAGEYEYLLSALQRLFPAQALTCQDVLATFAGLRPVVNTGKANPSMESREHVLWLEDGLLTVSGGKLTTFRLMARDALMAARPRLGVYRFERRAPILDPAPQQSEALLELPICTPAQRLRLLGRYGQMGAQSLASSDPQEWENLAGTPYHWAELRHAARSEGVVHLDDLLLRRLRLGLLLPAGGASLWERIRTVAQPELGWDDERWNSEAESYLSLIQTSYRGMI